MAYIGPIELLMNVHSMIVRRIVIYLGSFLLSDGIMRVKFEVIFET